MARLSIEQIKARLGQLLAERHFELDGFEHAYEEVIALDRLPGGLSCETFALTMSSGRRLILRIEPQFGLLEPYDIVREHRLTRLVGTLVDGIPAPLYIETDPDVLGARFALIEFIDGETHRKAPPDRAIANNFVSKLAEIHKVPVLEQAADILSRSLEDPSPALAEIKRSRQRLREGAVTSHPIIEGVLSTLEEHAPDCDRWVVLHGDYRLPNLKWNGSTVAGVLDWELADVGDPISDIAFTQTIGAGSCAIKGPLERLYTEITGIEIDPLRLAYYRLLHLARAAVIGLSAAGAIRKGSDDLRMLTVATQALFIESALPALETQFLQSLARTPT